MSELLRALRTRAYRAVFRLESRRLRRFKDVHRGAERCFVLGNGPSLKTQDLTLLKDEVTFGVNWILVHDAFDAIGLDYLCMSNPIQWRPAGTLPAEMLEGIRRHPELTLFFEHSFLRLNLRKRLIDRRRCYGVYVDYRRPAYRGYASLDPAKYTCHGHTVIIDLCLPLAYYMGFREVYLLGCDCDYRLDAAPDFSDAYFYDIGKQTLPPDSPAYLTGAWLDRAFASYETLKRAFAAGGGAIYNATAGGKLEVFPRRRYEEVLCGT